MTHLASLSRTAALACAAAFCAPAQAQPVYSGWLCCTMRVSGDWISDINYTGNGTRLIQAGTPVQITGHGRYRVHITIKGEPYRLGNDYSRDLDDAQFTERYIVRTDPAKALARWPQKVQEAIRTARVRVGMTREQVIMALGYPVSSENPALDTDAWRYWLGSFEEYQVHFNAAGKVREVSGAPGTLARVLMR